MKTLHRYLMRQVLATLVMTVAVFAFVLLLANILKEILVLLINRQATLWGVLEAFSLLVPWVLMFALPMGMLTAALLVFGRFSADQELTAVRSGGVSLVALVAPILMLSLVLCGFCAWINMEVAPKCRIAYKDTIARMAKKMTGSILPEGRYVSFPGCDIYVERNDGKEFHNLLIYTRDKKTGEEGTFMAERGRLEITNQRPILSLYKVQSMLSIPTNGTVKHVTGYQLTHTLELDYKLGQQTTNKPGYSDMTFRQLQAELRDLEERFGILTSWYGGTEELAKLKSKLIMPVRVQIHKQVAMSFACFGFTLIGIPLGIRAHRRETNAGVAMTLVLVFVYFGFLIVGQALQTRAEWAPHLIVWLPNFIFQSVGTVMLWRANRGI